VHCSVRTTPDAEIGIAHPFGAEQTWEVDAYVNVSFFTDNTAYRGVEILGQEPLPGIRTVRNRSSPREPRRIGPRLQATLSAS
jgi:hypothetical protein